MSLLGELLKAIGSLPPDPIEKQYRGVAHLLPSDYAPRGEIYRLKPNPALCVLTGCDGQHAMIVMNRTDVDALREQMRGLPSYVDVDQEIADACEQLFAQRELAKDG